MRKTVEQTFTELASIGYMFETILSKLTTTATSYSTKN